MITRRHMLAGLASVAIVPAVAKEMLDAPAISELASGGVVENVPMGVVGDMYYNMGPGFLMMKDAEGVWRHLGEITKLTLTHEGSYDGVPAEG